MKSKICKLHFNNELFRSSRKRKFGDGAHAKQSNDNEESKTP